MTPTLGRRTAPATSTSLVDLTTEDDYNPTSIQKQTKQTLDQYGNLTQMQVYNYGNLSTPAAHRT